MSNYCSVQTVTDDRISSVDESVYQVFQITLTAKTETAPSLIDDQIKIIIANAVSCLTAIDIERNKDSIVVVARSCNDDLDETEVEDVIVKELDNEYEVDVDEKEKTEEETIWFDDILSHPVYSFVGFAALVFVVCCICCIFFAFFKRKKKVQSAHKQNVEVIQFSDSQSPRSGTQKAKIMPIDAKTPGSNHNTLRENDMDLIGDKSPNNLLKEENINSDKEVLEEVNGLTSIGETAGENEGVKKYKVTVGGNDDFEHEENININVEREDIMETKGNIDDEEENINIADDEFIVQGDDDINDKQETAGNNVKE